MAPLQPRALSATERWRRVGMVALRVLAIVVAGLVVVVAVALAALHTDWGRDQLRGRVEAALDETFVGDVRVGRLEGSVLGELVLRDVEIDDASGAPAIVIETLRIDLGLLPLLHREAHLEHLAVSGLRVHGERRADGSLTLAELIVPNPEPRTWSVTIDDLAVDGNVELVLPDQTVHLDDLRIAAAVAAPAGGAIEVRGRVDGRWRERDQAIAASAELVAGPARIVITSAEIAVGELRAAVADGVIVGTRLAGTVTVTAPAAAVRTMVPDSPLRGDVVMALHARPGLAGDTLVTIAGTVGAARLDGGLTVSPWAHRIAGTLHAVGVDAGALMAGMVSSDLDVTLVVDLTRGAEPAGDSAADAGLAGHRTRRAADAAGVRGTVQVDGGGRILDLETRDVAIRVDLDGDHATVDGRGAGPGGLQASLAATIATQAEGGVVIERAHLQAHADDLHAASAGRSPVHGALDLDLHGHGRLVAGGPELAVAGTVTGRGLRVETSRIATLAVTVDATGLPARPGGEVHVEAGGIVVDGRPMGRLTVDARSRADRAIEVTAISHPAQAPWMIDARATVRVADIVTVTLGRHQFRTRGVTWGGAGGVITVGPEQITAHGVSTTIAGGRIAVDGSFRRGGRRAGDLGVALGVENLDLGEVARSLGRPEPVRGVVDARATVARRGGVLSGTLTIGGRGLATRPDAPPISLDAKLSIAPGAVAIDGRVAAPGIGAMTVATTIAAPRRLEDRRAWMRLSRDAVHQAKISIDGVDLAAAARLVQPTPTATPPVTGRLDAALTMTRTTTSGWLRVRDVRTETLAAPIDADLTVERVAVGVIKLTADVTAKDLGAAHADATIAVPTRPLDLAAWRALDASAVRGATIRVDDLVLDAARSRRLGLATPWTGKVDLRVEVAPAITSATATVALRGLRGGPLVRGVDGDLEAVVDAAGISVRVRGAVDGKWALGAAGRVDITVDELRAGGAALRRAPIAATITIDRLPLAALQRTLGGDPAVTGTLAATLKASGTVGARRGTAKITLTDAGVGTSRLRAFVLDAAYDGKTVTVDGRGEQHDGGKLRLRGKVAPDDLAKASGTVVATSFDLAPLGALGPARLRGLAGIVDANLRVRGAAAATAQIDGVIRAHRAQVPINASVGSLRQGEVEIELGGGRIRVEVDGRIGKGTVQLRGTAQLDGLVPRSAEATVVARDITLVTEAQPRLAGTVRLEARRVGDHWRVNALVEGARVVVPESKGHALHEPGQPADLVLIDDGRPPPAVAEPPATLFAVLGRRPRRPFMIAVIDLRPTSVQSSELRGRVRGKLTITAGEDGIAIDGAIDTAEGFVELFDHRYRIERAGVRFDGTDDPVLDVQLVRELPQLTMFVGLRGRLSKPELELSSRPGTYSEGQLLSFLLGGSPGADPGSEMRDAASGVASSLLSQKVGGYVQRYLPVDVDVLRFEAATGTRSAAFTVGKWLTRRLYLAYRRAVEVRPDQNTGEAKLEYWLGRNVLVEGTAGDRGVHGVDLLWLRRW